jgi:hypothetical protein
VLSDFNHENSKRLKPNASICAPAQSVTSKFLPAAYSGRFNFVTNHEQKKSDFGQCPIPRVHEEQMVMNAQGEKWQFLGVQRIVIVRLAANVCHYIGLNPPC